jgi:hypothetical protein
MQFQKLPLRLGDDWPVKKAQNEDRAWFGSRMRSMFLFRRTDACIIWDKISLEKSTNHTCTLKTWCKMSLIESFLNTDIGFWNISLQVLEIRLTIAASSLSKPSHPAVMTRNFWISEKHKKVRLLTSKVKIMQDPGIIYHYSRVYSDCKTLNISIADLFFRWALQRNIFSIQGFHSSIQKQYSISITYVDHWPFHRGNLDISNFFWLYFLYMTNNICDTS